MCIYLLSKFSWPQTVLEEGEISKTEKPISPHLTSSCSTVLQVLGFFLISWIQTVEYTAFPSQTQATQKSEKRKKIFVFKVTESLELSVSII
jgi:hypothetical protein